jgi:hypothetical protein
MYGSSLYCAKFKYRRKIGRKTGIIELLIFHDFLALTSDTSDIRLNGVMLPKAPFGTEFFIL